MDKLGGSPLKNLFVTKPEPLQNDEVSEPQKVFEVSNHARKEGETYNQYGFRVAGLSEGNPHTLFPCLQSVCWGIRKEQESDATLQKELQAKLTAKKVELETDRKNKEEELEACKDKQKEIAADIQSQKNKLADLEDSRYKRNRDAWITLVITTILLIPFTVYFFIFYSSVAYSAFFKVFDTNSLGSDGDFKLSEAVLDSAAFPNAWADGWGELLFILFMPIIFLAFGFVLNRWERENGWIKYIKIPALILVAFIFDSLLSFAICKKIYNLDSMMSLESRPDYSISLAIQDPQFWMIICLGFVSYLIWGFVFGYFVKAWENLDLNQIRKKEIEDKIAKLQKDLDAEKTNGANLRNLIASIGPKILEIDSQMSVSARYDLAKIKLELHNFFAGRQTYLAALHKSELEKQEATDLFNKMIETIKVVD
jgi:hypothetical protein